MFNDIHVHSRACDGNAILRAMDKIGMQRMAVIAPYMGHENFGLSEPKSDELQKLSTDQVTQICSADPDRLIAFAWIEPTLSGAASAVEYAVNDKKVKGIKMIPDHWYPYEERLFSVYRKIEELRKPILFHSGILWAFGDSSRFCRPAYYEVMLRFPKIKFALAHIGWPWTDECIAVAGRMRSATREEPGRKMQMYIDLTPGTPAIYRKDALFKAISLAGADWILWGSDGVAPDHLRSKEIWKNDKMLIVDKLHFKKKDFEKITLTNFDEFLKPME